MASATLSDVRKLVPNDRRAPYQQVADTVRTGIRAGTLEPLEPGEQLPALAALRETYDVSVGTAKSAITARREEGLVVILHGKGSFVRTELPDTVTGVGDELVEVQRAPGQLTGRMDAVERRLTDR